LKRPKKERKRSPKGDRSFQHGKAYEKEKASRRNWQIREFATTVKSARPQINVEERGPTKKRGSTSLTRLSRVRGRKDNAELKPRRKEGDLAIRMEELSPKKGGVRPKKSWSWKA